MALLPGYEYDIFISYRQKDNKGDHWVSNFVKALKDELDAAFKDDLNIYFDKNPHDGLHEMHDVDGSLKEKIKCIIFISVLSRTYCDPQSFAWQHEFLPFLDFASQDQFGLKVKLANGNVASRILPVRIYELSSEDNALFEKETGGPIRAIDFVFKSAGVNRPLLPSDKKEENFAHTVYRDQVNKMANVIGEIITSIRKPIRPLTNQTSKEQETYHPSPTSSRKKIWISLITVLVIVSGLWMSNKFMGDNQNQPGEITDKSIAVLPFTDISEGHDQAFFSDGMMVEILDHLFKIKGLRIIPRNSTLGYKDSTKPLKEIATELGVAHLVQGSVRRAGNQVKISVALIDGTTEKYLWQYTYDDDITEVSRIFVVQSDVAQQIAAALKARISLDVKQRIEAVPTANLKAYDFFLRGKDELGKYWLALNKDHVHNAIEFYNQAILLDPAFSDAFTGLGQCYSMLGHYPQVYTPDVWEKSKEYLNQAIELDPNNGWAYAELGLVQNKYDWDKAAALQSFQKADQLDPSKVEVHENFLFFYIYTQNCEEADRELNILKSIKPGDYFHFDVFVNMCRGQTDALANMKVPNILFPLSLFAAVERYLVLSEFDKALQIIEQEKKKLDGMWILLWQGEAFALSGKEAEAKKSIKELTELSKKQYVPHTYFASIYMALGEEDKAYEYLEKSLAERDGTALHDAILLAPFYNKRNDPRFKEFLKRTWLPLTN